MINKMKLIACCCLIIAMHSCTHAQKKGDIPKAVTKAFSAKYPGEDSPEWNVDSNGYYEAEFKQDGEKYRADFSKEGQWIETENDVKYSQLPDAVKETIKREHDKDEITEIEYVTHHSKGSFYDVEFKQKGKNFDLEVRPDGSLVKK